MANKSTYDDALVNQDLVVLRKIDLSVMDAVTLRMIGDSHIEYKRQERSLLWFRDGYILNDQPRIFDVIKEIMHVTLGFAVGRPDTGQILADGITLKQAEQAIRGAKTTLDIKVELSDIDEDEEVVVATPRKAQR